MRFLSLFSGIEAASVAWLPLGWACVAVAEFAAAPSAVLKHHYPDVPNLGDVTAPDFCARAASFLPDLIIGGSPCQAFSIAGLRRSLDDHRGNLSLRYIQIVEAVHAARIDAGLPGPIIVYENVPGLLSTEDNALGCFFGALVGFDSPLVPGRKQRWTRSGLVVGPERAAAWTVKDSQYFGLAQRRERVFVVACPLEGPDPSEILFEPEGVRRDHPPRRGEEADIAGALAGVPPGGGWCIGADEAAAGQLVAGTLLANGKAAGSAASQDAESGLLIAHTLRGEGFDASEDGTGRGIPLVPVNMREPQTFDWQVTGSERTFIHDRPSLCRALTANKTMVVAFDTTQITSAANRSNPQPGDPCHPLVASGHAPALAFGGNDTRGPIDVATCRNASGTASGRMDFESETFIVHAETVAPSLTHNPYGDHESREGLLVAFSRKDHGADVGDVSPTLRAMNHSGSHANAGGQVAIAYPILEPGRRSGKSTSNSSIGIGIGNDGDPMFTLNAERPHGVAVAHGVRRLMPPETEVLQGFPPGYTMVPMTRVNAAGETVPKWREIDEDEVEFLASFGADIEARGEPPRWYTTAMADGPRYMTHGNSMSVDVIRWIGVRIQKAVDALPTPSAAAE